MRLPAGNPRVGCPPNFRPILLLMPVLLLSAGCGAGGGAAAAPVGSPPTVTVTAPAQDVEVAESGSAGVTIAYVDADPDGDAVTELLADRDGDPLTTDDQIVIASGRPVLGETEQTVLWSASEAPAGTYKILAITHDATHVIVGEAPGLVLVNAAPTLAIGGLTVRSEEEGEGIPPGAGALRRLAFVSRGGHVGVEFVANDPDDVALTWITADVDGDPATASSADVASRGVPEADGAEQNVLLALDGASVGDRFTILGASWDGTNEPAQAHATTLAPDKGGGFRALPLDVEIRNVAYARSSGGASDEMGAAVAAFPDGSCVVTGRFGTSVVPGVATFGGMVIDSRKGFEQVEPETVLESAGQADVFVARYDPSGMHVWAKRAGGKGEDVGRGIAVFPDGSLVVTGSFKGTADFASQVSLTAEDSTDVFVARYDGEGALLWARRAGGAGLDEGVAVATLPDGSCLVAGNFQGLAVFGADEPRETTLNAPAGGALFLARYDRYGTLVWARQQQGAATALAAYRDGSCVVTGSADGTAIGGLFLARYGVDGTLLWNVGDQFDFDEDAPILWQENGPVYLHDGRTRPLPGQAVAVRPDGSCVVTARTEGDDGYVACYGAAGEPIWLAHGWSTGRCDLRGVTALPDGSVVVSGSITGKTILGFGEPRETLHETKGIVARLRHDGSLAWASGGGTSDVEGHAIAAAPDGSVLVTGPLLGYGVVGIGQEHETELEAVAGYDVFVARFNADGGF